MGRRGVVAFRSAKAAQEPRGFTLVEMLVAVALVVLMMLMFAQVFQTSAGLVSNQKGMAENDQSVRTLTILLRGDIKQRTFADVVPFVAGQNTEGGTAPLYDQRTRKGYEPEYRQGFFSISENDPGNSTDDVLHLTIRADSPLSRRSRLPYSGKSQLLRIPGTMETDDQYLRLHPDQPEFDDGQLAVNNTGSSNYAEVVWFLRNGNLYRRILLIRNPYDPGSGDASDPEDSAGNQFILDAFNYDFDNPPDMQPDEFWRRFDYAAYWDPGTTYDPTDRTSLDSTDTARGLKFHTASNALSNRSNDNNVAQFNGLPRSLGVPFLRYGSSISRFEAIDNPTFGRISVISGPREYIDSAAQIGFIGRFLVRESSDRDFNYPGEEFSFATDPFNEVNGRNLTLNPATALVDPYDNDTFRRGEDLVMANVHSFDIKVWDDLIGDFVDLGHNRTQIDPATGNEVPAGWYNANQMRLPDGTFGINTDFGNRYDTWHPSEFMPASPPYRPFNGDPTMSPENGLGADGEVWLKAIRIKMRFLDPGSDQMRDLTFTFRLNRENSAD